MSERQLFVAVDVTVNRLLYRATRLYSAMSRPGTGLLIRENRCGTGNDPS